MDKSDTIVEKTKKARYKEIFEMLDSDNDGKISAAKIDIKCKCYYISHSLEFRAT